MPDRALAAVLGLEDGVVEPLLAVGDDLGEVGVGGPGRHANPRIRQSQNLQKQSLPQFQASQQSKSRLRWPLPSLILSQKFKVKFKFQKMTRLFKINPKFNVSSMVYQEQENKQQQKSTSQLFSSSE